MEIEIEAIEVTLQRLAAAGPMTKDNFKVAVCHDDYTSKTDQPGYDGASALWIKHLKAAGCEVTEVDPAAPDILDRLKGQDAFMWRWAHFDGMYQIARRLLPVVENDLGLHVFPDQKTCWHYDDKVAQAYLMKAHDISHPKTWVFYDLKTSMEWIAKAQFPVVVKLASGAGSSNVALLHNAKDAERVARRIFRRFYSQLPSQSAIENNIKLEGFRNKGFPPQSGYLLLQEFLPNNGFDTRIMVIGNRAFGFRRFNRENDWRASGSGNGDYDPKNVDPAFVELAFECAKKLKMQSCAIDGLYRGKTPTIGEITYTFVSGMARRCPGHWSQSDDLAAPQLLWHEGVMSAEEAQVADLIATLKRKRDRNRETTT